MHKKVIVATYGTYDMLHIGHINILRRAKAYGDHLIVGVTSEDYDRSRGKLNVSQSTKIRASEVTKLDFVDEVIIERSQDQKIKDILENNVDIFVIGDDWVGKFDYLKEYCEVIYLPRTEGVSSTLLRESKNRDIKFGIIGNGRIASRFVRETEHVNNVILHSCFSRNIENCKSFVVENNIPYAFDNIDSFLASGVEAVYIASPHEFHYEQARSCLEANMHVLCEKPISLEKGQLKSLLKLARSKELVLLEAIKTAFSPAFNALLDVLKEGEIGEIVEVKGTFTKLIDDRDSREWSSAHGGALNELGSYPFLLAQKVLGPAKSSKIHSHIMGGVDSYSTVVSQHENGSVSVSSVGIGGKSEGAAVISGTKGYIYIPAPWWLTKEFFIRYENANIEKGYHYNYEGDGMRYEIAEFISLIQRKTLQSERLSYKDMKQINKIIVKSNKKRKNAE